MMIYNSDKPKRGLKQSKSYSYLITVRLLLLFGVTLLVMYGLLVFTHLGDAREIDCSGDFVSIIGDVVAPEGIHVAVQIENVTTVCPQSVSVSQTLRHAGKFVADFPYISGDSAVVIWFSADGYTTCAIEFNITDAGGFQFYAELADSWTITVTESTLQPPRYVPHQQRFTC